MLTDQHLRVVSGVSPIKTCAQMLDVDWIEFGFVGTFTAFKKITSRYSVAFFRFNGFETLEYDCDSNRALGRSHRRKCLA